MTEATLRKFVAAEIRRLHESAGSQHRNYTREMRRALEYVGDNLSPSTDLPDMMSIFDDYITGNHKSAWRKINRLDTIVREVVPDSIYDELHQMFGGPL